MDRVSAQEPIGTPQPSDSQPRFTAADIIDTVNSLRLSNGVSPLSIHPALMQVAQTEANGLAAGYGGHWRPNGLTLGQWLLSLGYPLSGDLSLDGYRSENWFSMDVSTELADVMHFWQGDALHRDTMLSPDRSDIGAAIAVSPDGQLFVVLETALRTASGKMQYDAYAVLTGIPRTQVANSALGTLAAENGLLPQYSVPVALNTPGPDGAIYHEVRYGQSLWSIAIAYRTTIKSIQALNRLSSTVVYEGQKLLVMQGAAQAPAGPTPGDTPHAGTAAFASSPRALPAPTEQLESSISPLDDRSTALSLAAVVLAGGILAWVFAAAFRKKPAA